jgi:hypothetical protein
MIKKDTPVIRNFYTFHQYSVSEFDRTFLDPRSLNTLVRVTVACRT